MEQRAISWDGSDMILQLEAWTVTDIIDRDEWGDVVGIEIFGLHARHPGINVIEG